MLAISVSITGNAIISDIYVEQQKSNLYNYTFQLITDLNEILYTSHSLKVDKSDCVEIFVSIILRRYILIAGNRKIGKVKGSLFPIYLQQLKKKCIMKICSEYYRNICTSFTIYFSYNKCVNISNYSTMQNLRFILK